MDGEKGRLWFGNSGIQEMGEIQALVSDLKKESLTLGLGQRIWERNKGLRRSKINLYFEEPKRSYSHHS